MVDRISWTLIVPLVALALSPEAPMNPTSADDRMDDQMKDKWAVVFFGEALEDPIKVIDAEKANAVDIYLVQSWQDPLVLTAENRAGRSCVGIALFTIAQSADFVSDGRVTASLDPDLAAVKAWLFPPEGGDPAMVQVGTKTLQTVVPRMLELLREDAVLPFPLSDLNGAGCGAPLPVGAA